MTSIIIISAILVIAVVAMFYVEVHDDDIDKDGE